MDEKALERLYEKEILPKYGGLVSLDAINWKDHGKVDLDAWAHYFEDKNGREYVLLWEDFPGSTFLDDSLTHEVVSIDTEMSLRYIRKEGEVTPNLYGYFTLFREKQSRP